MMLSLLLYIALIGAVVWLIEAFIPMAEPFKTLVRIIAVVLVIFLLVSLVGGAGGIRAPEPVIIR